MQLLDVKEHKRSLKDSRLEGLPLFLQDLFHFALVFGKIEVSKPDGEDIHFVEILSGGGVVLFV